MMIKQNAINKSMVLYLINNDINSYDTAEKLYNDWAKKTGYVLHNPDNVYYVLNFLWRYKNVPRNLLLAAAHVDGFFS